MDIEYEAQIEITVSFKFTLSAEDDKEECIDETNDKASEYTDAIMEQVVDLIGAKLKARKISPTISSSQLIYGKDGWEI
jgi:hypothetical protein